MIIKKFIATSVIALMMSVMLVPATKAYATSGSVNGSDSVPKTGTVTEETEDLSGLSGVDPASMTREELIEHTKAALDSSSPVEGGYELEEKDDCIIITMWYDGMDDMLKIVETDPTYKELWSHMDDSMCEACDQYYQAYKLHDMDVYLYLVNELDHDKLILASRNGELIYDCVNEIDKRIDYNR
ncbi:MULTISPECIES: hypothetical protein [unclassified Butyrivibrio]|uniref:hypothetical protein n=1 Tax=unclassified Butyrivibrio TaxID=2639466 RepID=UPI0003FE696C|nr:MULTISPECIES: hypothetical protein [unclassified Butyrivibrio]